MGEAREVRESEQKIGTGREIKRRPLSFYPRNAQPNICPRNGRPRKEWAQIIIVTKAYFCRGFYKK